MSGMSYSELLRLVDSFERVDNATMSREDAEALLANADAILTWLHAEKSYRNQVQKWLEAEKAHADLGAPLYAAAKAGWDAMREQTENLDGVEHFSLLPPILRNRYATFAKAAIDYWNS